MSLQTLFSCLLPVLAADEVARTNAPEHVDNQRSPSPITAGSPRTLRTPMENKPGSAETIPMDYSDTSSSSTKEDVDTEIEQAIREPDPDQPVRAAELEVMLGTSPKVAKDVVPRASIVPGTAEFQEWRSQNYYYEPGIMELHKLNPEPSENQIWEYVNEKYNLGETIGGTKYVVYCYPTEQKQTIFRNWEELVGITVFTSKQRGNSMGPRVLERGLQIYLLDMQFRFTIAAIIMKRKSPPSKSAKFLELIISIPEECLDPSVQGEEFQNIPIVEWFRIVELTQVDYSRSFTPLTYQGFCSTDDWEVYSSMYVDLRESHKNLPLTQNLRFPQHLIPKYQRNPLPPPAAAAVRRQEPETEGHDSEEEEPVPDRPVNVLDVPVVKPKRSRKSIDPFSPVVQMREDKKRAELLRTSTTTSSAKKRKKVPKAKKKSRVRFSSSSVAQDDSRVDSEYETEYEEPDPAPEPVPQNPPQVSFEGNVGQQASVPATTPVQFVREVDAYYKRIFLQLSVELMDKVDARLGTMFEKFQTTENQVLDVGTKITNQNTDLKLLNSRMDTICDEQRRIKDSIKELRKDVGTLKEAFQNQGSLFTMEDIQIMEQRRDLQTKALIDQVKSVISMILPGPAAPHREPQLDYHTAMELERRRSRTPSLGRYPPYWDARTASGPEEPVHGLGIPRMEDIEQHMGHRLKQADQESGYEDMTRRRTPEKPRRSTQSRRPSVQDFHGTSATVPEPRPGVPGTPSSEYNVEDPYEIIRRLRAQLDEQANRR